MTIKIVSIALAAAAVLGVSTPAFAGTSAEEHYSVTVGYSDLGLANAEGRAALQARLRGAERRMCSVYGHVPLAEQMVAAKCRANFRAQADSQLKERFAAAKIRESAIRGTH